MSSGEQLRENEKILRWALANSSEKMKNSEMSSVNQLRKNEKFLDEHCQAAPKKK